MLKIAIIGIVTIMLAIQFKGHKQEYGIYISMAGCLIIFYLGIQKLGDIVDTIRTIQGYMNVNPVYITILIKMIGIAYIAEFSSSLCKDAGYGAISGQIDLIGKLSILAISMPILMALLEIIQEFMV